MHRRTGGNPFYVSQILDQPERGSRERARGGARAGRGLNPASGACWSCSPARPSRSAASCSPRSGYPGGDGRAGRRDRPGRPARTRGGVPARDRPDGGARRGRARSEPASARGADRRVGDDRGRPERAGPPRGGGRGRAAPAALRAGGGGGASRSGRTARRSRCTGGVEHAPEGSGGPGDLLERLATSCTSPTGWPRPSPRWNGRWSCTATLGDEVAVGAAHRMLSDYAWYAGDGATAKRHDDAATPSCGPRVRLASGLRPGEPRLPGRPPGRRRRRDGRRHRGAGDRRRLGDPALHATAAVGLSVARIYRRGPRGPGRPAGRAATPGCANGSTSWPPPR